MSTLRKLLLFTILTLTQLNADTIGGEASFGFFNHKPGGETAYKAEAVNLNDTLGFNEAQDIFLKAYLEHPLPLIPNLKFGYTALSHDGSSSVNDFTWGEIDNFTGTIESSASLDMIDVTLYYELLDNWAEVDAGVTLRYIDGEVGVTAELVNDTAMFSTWVPLLYGKARFNMPVTDLSFQLEANAVNYAEITAYDYELSARYTLMMGLGLEAGYKALYLDSDDLTEGFYADIDFSGPYAAVIWDF
jgi:outer membrane protein